MIFLDEMEEVEYRKHLTIARLEAKKNKPKDKP